ncbi:MAG TPA: toxin-antitoxin system YwqK family antitoxin [Draconibacterium sp.]|nr:toxin-antitoxin system YwqK family antitoxin [Draconibacterium sp.]
MKRYIIILLVLFPFLGFSQINKTDVNGLRQGLWKKEYSNGKTMYEGYFRDGKPVGEWKRFHEGGQVKALINYQENSDTAFAQLFDEWGKKVAEGNFVNEKKEGTWEIFSDNRKVAEENYVHGLKDGLCRKFYDSGQVLEESEWENGKQEGKHQVFYKNGNPYMQCKYSNNLRNGLCLSYFPNGKIEMEAYYKNSLRNGNWKFYNENGDLLYTLEYKDGKLLNPEVRDSIDNLQIQKLENGKNSIPDPEKFMQDPSEYMRKMKIYR